MWPSGAEQLARHDDVFHGDGRQGSFWRLLQADVDVGRIADRFKSTKLSSNFSARRVRSRSIRTTPRHAQTQMKDTLDEAWAKSVAATLRDPILPKTLKSAKALMANAVMQEVAKKTIGL